MAPAFGQNPPMVLRGIESCEPLAPWARLWCLRHNPPGGRGVARIILFGQLAGWVGTLAGHLHGRNAWRLQRLAVGIILAQGRRTVTSWFRAAGITRGYRSYYYFLA